MNELSEEVRYSHCFSHHQHTQLFGMEYLLALSWKQFSPAEEDFDSCPDEGFEENQVPGTKSLHAVQSL